MHLTSIVYNQDYNIGLKSIPDGYFDMAICDVPYGLDVGRMPYLTETQTTIKQKNGKQLNPNRNKEKYTLKAWDKEVPNQEYIEELKRVSRHQIIFGVEYANWTGLGTGRIKWVKGVPDKLSFKGYELAYCSLIEETVDIPLLWSGMNQAKDLKYPMVQQGNKKLNEKRIHPTHKPRLLYRKLISDYGFEGMKLLDTHVGGGSIRIEAYLAKCHFIGYEIDGEYYEKQEKRFNQFRSQQRLFV